MDINFFQEHNISLSLQDIALGVKYEFIDLDIASKLVDQVVFNNPNDSQALDLSLKIILNGNYSYIYDEFFVENDFILDKWRYILLLWAFDNRLGDSSDYEKINMIYASFGYPEDMNKLVNYNPVDPKENLQGGYEYILDNWIQYLKEYDYLIGKQA